MNQVKQTLSPEEVAEATELYKEFWRRHPDLKNPSDINCQEKADFLIEQGFPRINLMQRARKQAYDFTKLNEADVD